MQESTSKQKILKRIRQALIQQNPKPYPEIEGNSQTMKQGQEELAVQFAEQFAAHNGLFVFCESEDEVSSNLNDLILNKSWEQLFCHEPGLQKFFEKYGFATIGSEWQVDRADAAITSCESLIARTGSILVSSGQYSGRLASIFPPVHIVIATTDQLVYDIGDGFARMKKHYGDTLPSMISLTTGPSQTADIEKTLVLGAHGPKELYLFLIDEQQKQPKSSLSS